MSQIVKILMERDNLSYEAATDVLNDLREQAAYFVEEGDLLGLEDLLMDEVGLEPDYIFELFELDI